MRYRDRPVQEPRAHDIKIRHMASERRRKQAELEFHSAIAALTQILPNDVSVRLSQLDKAFPVIDDPQVTSISAHVSQLDEAINSVLRPTKVDKSKSSKVKEVVTRWLRVSYPFSRLFLNVAKSGCSVNFRDLQILLIF